MQSTCQFDIQLHQYVRSLDVWKRDSAKREGIDPKLEEVAFNFCGKDLKERKEHQKRGELDSFIMGKGFCRGKKNHIK